MMLLSCSLVLLATVSASPSAAVVSGGGGGAGGGRRLVGRPADDQRLEDGASALALAVGTGLRGAGTAQIVSERALKSVKSPPSVTSAKSEKVATLPSSDSGTTGTTARSTSKKVATLPSSDSGSTNTTKSTTRSSSKKMATLPSSNSVTSETTGSIASDSGTGTTKPTALSADDARSSSKKMATLPSSDSASPDSGTTGTTKPTTRSSSKKVATLSSETSITTSRSTRSLEDDGSGKGGKGGKKRFGGRTGLSQDEAACDCLAICGDIEELVGFSDVVEEYDPSKGTTSMTSSDTAIEAKAEKNGDAKDDDKKSVLDVARGEGGSLPLSSKAGSKTGRSIGSSFEKMSKGNSSKSRKASETSTSGAKLSKGGGRKLLHAGKTLKKAKGGCSDFCGCDPPAGDQLLGFRARSLQLPSHLG